MNKLKNIFHRKEILKTNLCYDDEDSFQQMRGEALLYAKDRLEKLLRKFLDAIDYKKDNIAYKDNIYKNELILYSRNPGVIIGCKGKNIDLLKSMLEKEYNKNINIKLEEVSEILITNNKLKRR